MSITFALTPTIPTNTESIGVPVFADAMEDEGSGAGIDLDWAFLAHRGFKGSVGETTVVPSTDGRSVIAVGVGRRHEVDADVIRTASAALARAASVSNRVSTLMMEATPPSLDRAHALQAVAEGTALAAYSFNRYKSDPDENLIEALVVIGDDDQAGQAALARGAAVAGAVVFARDLVNEPGGTMTARALAERAWEVAHREGLELTVLDEVDIEAARLGGLLGVNRGSEEPPRFIELTYAPENPVGFLALVGKGITFDSGGLSLKTAEGMANQKTDMSGGAAVLAAMSALSSVGCRAKVTGYIPATDNMTGGDATRPGDVLRIRNGTTVEVLNTDAEGRLVLADALSMATEADPDAIVDIATLTGACKVALGQEIGGMMGTSEALLDQVQKAADHAGEPIWRLPLAERYRKELDSEVADLRNIGQGRFGGALTAGLFLREFVGEHIPWVHLDIAGPARSDTDEGIFQKGGTGFGVRTLLELAAAFSPPRDAPE